MEIKFFVEVFACPTERSDKEKWEIFFHLFAKTFKGFEEKIETKIVNPEIEYWKEIDRIVKDLDEWRKKVKEEKSEPKDELKWLEGWINKYRTDHFNNSVDDFLKWLKDMIYIRPEPAKEEKSEPTPEKRFSERLILDWFNRKLDFKFEDGKLELIKPDPEEKIEVGDLIQMNYCSHPNEGIAIAFAPNGKLLYFNLRLKQYFWRKADSFNLLRKRPQG